LRIRVNISAIGSVMLM